MVIPGDDSLPAGRAGGALAQTNLHSTNLRRGLDQRDEKYFNMLLLRNQRRNRNRTMRRERVARHWKGAALAHIAIQRLRGGRTLEHDHRLLRGPAPPPAPPPLRYSAKELLFCRPAPPRAAALGIRLEPRGPLTQGDLWELLRASEAKLNKSMSMLDDAERHVHRLKRKLRRTKEISEARAPPAVSVRPHSAVSSHQMEEKDAAQLAKDAYQACHFGDAVRLWALRLDELQDRMMEIEMEREDKKTLAAITFSNLAQGLLKLGNWKGARDACQTALAHASLPSSLREKTLLRLRTAEVGLSSKHELPYDAATVAQTPEASLSSIAEVGPTSSSSTSPQGLPMSSNVGHRMKRELPYDAVTVARVQDMLRR